MNCDNSKKIRILILLNIMFLVLTGILYYGVTRLLLTTQSQIELYKQEEQQHLLNLEIKIQEESLSGIKRDKEIVDILSELDKNIINTKNNLSNLRKEFFYLLNADLKDIDKIKNANLQIYNITSHAGGSGTHIKIKGKDYILTVAHLLDKVNDELWAVEDNGHFIKMQLVQFNKKIDLALFEIENLIRDDYLEISDIEPKEGSNVSNMSSLSRSKSSKSWVVRRRYDGYYRYAAAKISMSRLWLDW